MPVGTGTRGGVMRTYYNANNAALKTYRDSIKPGGVNGRQPGQPWTPAQMAKRREAYKAFKASRKTAAGARDTALGGL